MLNESPLGKITAYIQTYSPGLLFAYSRRLGRDLSGIHESLPFQGPDIWNGYELSWLNSKGRPEIGLARFCFPCTTPNLIESKSFKLYLNSFNQHRFDSREEVSRTIKKDLSEVCGGIVDVELFLPEDFDGLILKTPSGICLDRLDPETDVYEVCPELLEIYGKDVEETVFTHLFKSNCLATGQPDWATVSICYSGPQIDHTGLLRYLISYRNHQGFHEHCVERIFNDLLKKCRCSKLSVYARYTRRGGLDINPFRSNFESAPRNDRLARQ